MHDIAFEYLRWMAKSDNSGVLTESYSTAMYVKTHSEVLYTSTKISSYF